MPELRLILDGDGCWPDLVEKTAAGKVHHLAEGARIDLAGLPGGMRGGHASVAFRFDLPNGETVIAETSLRLLLTAADTFKARYGDPRTDATAEPMRAEIETLKSEEVFPLTFTAYDVETGEALWSDTIEAGGTIDTRALDAAHKGKRVQLETKCANGHVERSEVISL